MHEHCEEIVTVHVYILVHLFCFVKIIVHSLILVLLFSSVSSILAETMIILEHSILYWYLVCCLPIVILCFYCHVVKKINHWNSLRNAVMAHRWPMQVVTEMETFSITSNACHSLFHSHWLLFCSVTIKQLFSVINVCFEMVPGLQCHVIRYRSNWSNKGEVSVGTNEPILCLKSKSF